MLSGDSMRSSRRGRKPGAFVLRDLAPEDACTPIDWSVWYVTDEDDTGESAEQGEIIRILLSTLGVLAAERSWGNVYLGADQFFAWLRNEPMVRVSPDVYLIDEPPPAPLPKSWQTWLPGHKPPRWAVEIVSEDWKKDYEDAPAKYAQLGTRELVIFDPEAATSAATRGARVPLQVYRRDDDGAFVLVYRGDGPVRSNQIGAFLVVQSVGATMRLRVARDASGTDLVPTVEEARRAADQRAETAEERVRALEAELAALRSAS
jgi:Uma2 family endonuclease